MQQADESKVPVGYCVRCQTKREIAEPKQIERGGGPAIEGKCTVCGFRMFVMGGTLGA
jgi:DNA-directed RNA polymerase subunit RPC12/RpoP